MTEKYSTHERIYAIVCVWVRFLMFCLMFCLPAGVVAIVMKRATKKKNAYNQMPCIRSLYLLYAQIIFPIACMLHNRIVHTKSVWHSVEEVVNEMKRRKKRKTAHSDHCMRCALNWLFLLLLHLGRSPSFLFFFFQIHCVDSRATDSESLICSCNWMSVLINAKMLSQNAHHYTILPQIWNFAFKRNNVCFAFANWK